MRNFTIGEKAQLSKVISMADIYSFAEITGDHNPVHIDEDFASKTRFNGQIAHGMLCAGLISAVLGMKLPGPGGIYLSQSLKFISPVRPGDTIAAEVTVKEWNDEKKIISLSTRCYNQLEKDVLIGEALLLVEDIFVV